MGGSSSGRYRTRNRGHMEGTMRVDLRKLNKAGALKPGKAFAVTSDWGPLGSLRVEVDLTHDDDPHLRLSLNGDPMTRRVRLDAVPMRYGGSRYYALCPHTHRRCEVLPILKGVVGCRQFHRLSYVSQHRDPLTACHRAIERVEKRVHGSRRKNRERQEARLEAAHEKLYGHIASFDCPALRRWGHLIAA